MDYYKEISNFLWRIEQFQFIPARASISFSISKKKKKKYPRQLRSSNLIQNPRETVSRSKHHRWWHALIALRRAYHPLRNSVHVQDGGCSLLLTCTAPDSLSPPFSSLSLSILHRPPPLAALLPPLAKAALPFRRRERRRGALRRDACVCRLSVPTVYHHHMPIATGPCFSRRNESWSWKRTLARDGRPSMLPPLFHHHH